MLSRIAWTVLAASGIATAAQGVQQPPDAGKSSGSKIVLLGTGTPAATPDRSGPATAIVVNDTAYLVLTGDKLSRAVAVMVPRPLGSPT